MNYLKKIILASLLLAGSLFCAVDTKAQQPSIYSTASGAIDGYDPVAYFTEGKPVKGMTEFTYTYQGANWHFSSKRNLDMFVATPEKFIPQFGGYCAYGCVKGHKASTQPDAWTIVGGKLYFNYNKDVKALWSKDSIANIAEANKAWMQLKDSK